MLSQLINPVTILHKGFPKGTSFEFLPGPLFSFSSNRFQSVYQIPTENEKTDNSALTLQRLFYLLETSTDALGTNELTKSFGWETKHIFEQQDVQELCRVLMEKLEEKMKGSEAENALAKMFVGKTKTYISCINVEYESSRIEEYWDIQLTVRGKKNLDESFRDYIAYETLEGENKYFAEGHGLQDAKKGVIFESFPPVLHIHLKRFDYDFMRDAITKVHLCLAPALKLRSSLVTGQRFVRIPRRVRRISISIARCRQIRTVRLRVTWVSFSSLSL